MTNKEAISELSALMTHYNAFSKESEAVGVAIKAIEREPIPDDCEILTKEAYSDLCLRAAKAEQEECEDCIDRKELIKWMKKFINDTAETGRLISLGIVDEHIREMPSVKPKHVFAHWSRLKGTSWYKCQNCDYKTDARHNFCPRCGCQMEDDLK